jgi:phosphoglycerate dehydrogenase-like enzyme
MTKAAVPQLPCPKPPDQLAVLIHHHLSRLYLDELKARFPALRLIVLENNRDLPATLERERPDAVLSFKIPNDGRFPRETLLDFPSVRWLHATGAGIEHLPPWNPDKVMVTNSAGIHGGIMAEYAVWAVLHQTLQMPRYLEQQAQSRWALYPVDPAAGKTAVIVGMGRVGRPIAEKLRAMGLRIVGVRRHPEPAAEADVTYTVDDLPKALGLGDFVILILPLTAETRGLFDAEMLRRCKPGAHIVNLARGGIVDERALRALIDDGHIAGATFDVFHTEPLPANDPMWSAKNVIVTPHSSGEVASWQAVAARVFADNLERWVAGRPLANLCNPTLGY